MSSVNKTENIRSRVSSTDVENDSGKYFRVVKNYLPLLYVIFLLLPIYSLVCYSFKTEFEIKNSITPIPMLGTLANYKAIFSDRQSCMAFVNSLIYGVIHNDIYQ